MATLWRHSNGTYYVKFENRRQTLKTKDEPTARRRFNNWLRNRKRELRETKSAELLAKSFVPFKNEYLAWAEVNYEKNTYKLYEVALDKAVASWGDIRLKDITGRHIESYITDMIRAGLKPPTINKNYRHLKSALRKAMEWKYLNRDIKFPKQLKERRLHRYIPKEALQAIFNAITDNEFYDLCLLGLYSGLRRAEVMRLTWDDVDNPKGFMRITTEQKNKTESRVPINTTMREVINRRDRGREKLFRFNTADWITQKFKGYLVDAGHPNYRFHDLRHTFGSNLAMQGHSPKVIMELMRHKSIQSTMIYLELSPDHLKDVSESLNMGIEKRSKKNLEKEGEGSERQ